MRVTNCSYFEGSTFFSLHTLQTLIGGRCSSCLCVFLCFQVSRSIQILARVSAWKLALGYKICWGTTDCNNPPCSQRLTPPTVTPPTHYMDMGFTQTQMVTLVLLTVTAVGKISAPIRVQLQWAAALSTVLKADGLMHRCARDSPGYCAHTLRNHRDTDMQRDIWRQSTPKRKATASDPQGAHGLHVHSAADTLW